MSFTTKSMLCFFLLSLVSPPVFVGLILIALVAIVISNVDAALTRFGIQLSFKSVFKPISIPCNLCLTGTLMAICFTAFGLAWGSNPQLISNVLNALSLWTVILLHFVALIVFVASIFKFVQLAE